MITYFSYLLIYMEKMIFLGALVKYFHEKNLADFQDNSYRIIFIQYN